MYVCICNGVTDSEIRAAAARGAGSIDEVAMETGATTCCGLCACTAREVFESCCTQPEPDAAA